MMMARKRPSNVASLPQPPDSSKHAQPSRSKPVHKAKMSIMGAPAQDSEDDDEESIGSHGEDVDDPDGEDDDDSDEEEDKELEEALEQLQQHEDTASREFRETFRELWQDHADQTDNGRISSTFEQYLKQHNMNLYKQVMVNVSDAAKSESGKKRPTTGPALQFICNSSRWAKQLDPARMFALFGDVCCTSAKFMGGLRDLSELEPGSMTLTKCMARLRQVRHDRINRAGAGEGNLNGVSRDSDWTVWDVTTCIKACCAEGMTMRQKKSTKSSTTKVVPARRDNDTGAGLQKNAAKGKENVTRQDASGSEDDEPREFEHITDDGSNDTAPPALAFAQKRSRPRPRKVLRSQALARPSRSLTPEVGRRASNPVRGMESYDDSLQLDVSGFAGVEDDSHGFEAFDFSGGGSPAWHSGTGAGGKSPNPNADSTRAPPSPSRLSLQHAHIASPSRRRPSTPSRTPYPPSRTPSPPSRTLSDSKRRTATVNDDAAITMQASSKRRRIDGDDVADFSHTHLQTPSVSTVQTFWDMFTRPYSDRLTSTWPGAIATIHDLHGSEKQATPSGNFMCALIELAPVSEHILLHCAFQTGVAIAYAFRVYEEEEQELHGDARMALRRDIITQAAQSFADENRTRLPASLLDNLRAGRLECRSLPPSSTGIDNSVISATATALHIMFASEFPVPTQIDVRIWERSISSVVSKGKRMSETLARFPSLQEEAEQEPSHAITSTDLIARISRIGNHINTRLDKDEHYISDLKTMREQLSKVRRMVMHAMKLLDAFVHMETGPNISFVAQLEAAMASAPADRRPALESMIEQERARSSAKNGPDCKFQTATSLKSLKDALVLDMQAITDQVDAVRESSKSLQARAEEALGQQLQRLQGRKCD